jgi:uncharacterized repeat protein (TIGR02543 family)/uncharacterized repeat protein (TIGR02059 family)
VQAIEVAAVTLDGEDVTAIFAKTTEVSDVYGVAQELLAAFKAELEEAELVLTVGGDEATFHLDDENVAVEIARFLLGGLTPEEFLAQRDAVEAGYTATAIDKYGVSFDLEGSLKFQTVFTEAEAKDAFLAALDEKVQAIDVAKVTLDGEDVTAVFAKTTEVSDVYGVAQELLAAFKAELEEAELVLTVGGDEATFHLDDENVAVEIARFLLGGLTPEEFLAQRDAVEAGYTATAIDKYGMEFGLEGSLKFQTVFTEAEAKDAFLVALDEKVQAIEVAAVTLDGEDVTAVFAKTTEVSDVYGVAQELLAAFKAELEEAELVLTVGGDEATFHLDDENVAVEIARFLLGGLTPEEFLAQRDAVEAGYTATAIDKYGVSFDLEGSLKFQTVFTEAEAKDAFLAALDDKVQAIEVAAVTLDGEDVTAVFAKTTEVSDVYGVAQELLAAFKAELEEAELVLTVGGDEATFHLDDENVAVEIARFLLGGLTPEEFLAQRDAVEAGYTATAIDKYGVSFDLEGSLKFQTVFTEAEAKDAFLAALDEKVQAIEVAAVTLDGEDVTAIFAKTTEVSDVYGVAQELLAAFKAELEEAELVLTVGGDEATFHLDDENVAVEIARFLLGGLTPEEFLAQRDAVEAGYTATAIDKYGVSFDLEGSLKFQTVFTEAEAKDAFLAALDDKVQAIEVAAVTLDGEDVTAIFAKTTEVSDVYGVAQELLAAFKAELEEAELVLTVGVDEATFHLDDENVAVEIARFLLGGLTPEEFLAQRYAVEAGYTATAVDKYGVSFGLEGILKFQTVFTEAEAKDAFLAALDDKVQAIDVAKVTLDGEDVTAVFAKTTEVSDVYGVAQELLAAFKAELEEAELVLTVGGDEATFHLDDENVAVEIARFLLGGLTPEEFLAQRDAVEAGYTATAIDKYGMEFGLEGSLKFQTVFTEAEAKDAFLAALDDKVQAIEVAAVTLDGEDVTAVFAKTTEVSDVYGVAQELLAAFKAELEEAELVLTVAGDEATFHLDDENVAVEIARFLLGGLTPEEFLAQRDAVEAGYTATAIDKYGVSFDLEGSLKFQTVFTEAEAKDAFLVALDEKVQAIEVAAVTLDGEDVTAVFAKTTEVSDVYGVAQELLAAFKAELEEAELVLTAGGDEATFHLDDENVAVEIARFLLGGLTPEEFLAQRDAVEAGYTATAIDKYGVSFDLEGSLKFQTVFTEAEAKDAFLAALDEKVQAIEVAAVTLDGEDVTAIFAKTTEVSDVYGVAQELLAAFKAELEEAELVLTVGGDEATFHLDDENVAVEIARFLLGGLTPEEFLAQRDAVEAGYTATAIDKYGMEFGLEGSLKFQTVFTEAEAKDAFLAALDDKVQAIEVAAVTLDGEDVTAVFAKTTEVSDVYGVAQELLAAFKAELEEAELVLTVAGDEATFHLDDENVAVEIARFLLGGLTPEEFLAQRDAVEAGYTATAIDKYGVSFDLEGSLKFQTVFTEAEAKDAFLVALDEKVQAIEVAAVTLDGEDVTAVFAKTTEVSDVYGVAQELLAAFKAELEEAELVLTAGGDEATFHLDDENVAVEIARFLLGGLTPEEFLAQRDAVEAGYTATAIDKYGVSFDLEGSLKFQTVFTEAEAKDAFLAALDEKVQAIEVAAVTLDGEDVTAIFAKTTEVSDVYGVAQELLAAFKAELEEAELVLTVGGDEATFHLDDENVAVEIARFLLGGLTPEEFLAQRDAVEAGYTATAIDKYGVSFDLEGSLKFQTVFTEAEAKDAFLAALDDKVQAIEVAAVTLDGEDVTAIFAKTTEVSDVYGVAQELLAAFKAELEEAELVLTVGGDEATFHLDDENVAVEIARFLLGGLTPEEFLAQRDAVEAGYTATAIDKYGVSFDLEGSLKFQTVFTEAEAKDAFLAALDDKVQAIEVAAVTLDGEDVTAIFAKTTEVSDVYGVAQELLAAFKAELEEAELVLTVGVDEATFHLDDENVAVEIARFLLGGLTPEEFLAQRYAVEAGYTATAVDKYGVSFGLEGILKFQTVFTEAEAKDAFLAALDDKVQAIDVAKVTLDGEDVTAVFAKTTEVSDVYGVAQELLAAFKAELEEAELVLTVGGDEATFHLDDENVAVEIARFLLGGLTPEEFLAQRDAVEAGYTATAIDKYGMEFGLEGSLKFQTVFTEAEAKDAFLAALDDKVQAIEVAAVTLDGEDVTAVFAKTTEVSDVYGVAQELLAAFKAELEEAELVLTVAGDEATFHLDDENVAVEIARFLLGGLTPEEFLAQRDAVEAGYTATAIDKYGVSFDLEGSLKFQTVFTEAEAKDAFLVALDEKVQAIEVAAVTLDGEDVTAVFAKTTEVSDVYGVAQELLAAFKAELEEAELVLTAGGDEATFHLDDENVAVEIARFLLGGLTPEEFLAQRDAVEAGYTATAIDKYGVSFDLEGSLKFQTVFTEAEAKDAFLAALDEKVQAIEVAAVTLDGEDVTAIFAKTTEVSDVYGVAQELLAAFKAELEEAELVLTVGGDEATFHLDDENVAVEIARFLLGGLTPEEFLAQRDAVEAGYTATAIDKYGMEFGLEGSLKFQTVFTEAEAKDAFLAALDDKVQAIEVAAVTLDGEDVTAVFAKTTEVSDVYGVAQELLAAFKAELEEAELVLTVAGDEATFHLDDENVAVEIARFLLGGLTPEEFLAQRDAVEAGYTATAIDKYGVSFDLEGSLKFQTVFTEAEAKDAFLVALDEKVQAIEVAAVTLDGEDVTAVFAKTTEVSDVYGVAQELLAAFKAELEEAELVLTAGGDEATFHLDDENVAVEIARFLLGGLTPEEFLAQRDAVEAGYTATAIDKYGVSFDLEGSLKFQTVFTEAEAKDAFLAALDEKVQAIEVAAVTLDGEDVTAIFAKTTEVSDVYGVAQELLAAFKAELEEAELVLTVGGDEATFHLDDENVAVEIARFLLGGLTPEEFLAQRDAVEAGYTATAIDKYGVSFDLEGSLKFQTVFTEAEAKDAFLAALDDKVQAIEVAAVTLDGEDVTAIFAKTTEVSDVYGVAQELLAAFKAELEEAELVLTVGGDEATFHLDDENVAVEIARFLLGGLTPEEFLAQRDAVEAGYTATAIDKYGVSFDLEGSLKFQTVFTEAEAKDAFLAALDDKVQAIEVAAVTLDGEDVTAFFEQDANISAVYQMAQGLFSAFQDELDEAEIVLTPNGAAESETFYLDDETVVIAVARYLLGDLSPEQFLDQRIPIMASYTATATDKHGTYFELSGYLRFLHKYTVNFDVDGGSEIAEQIVNYGERPIEPPTPTKHGYNFDGWFADVDRNERFDFDIPITGDTTIYAKWIDAQYWSYEIDPDTQNADFGIGLVDMADATHFELNIGGTVSQRAPVNACISEVTIPLNEDPVNFEVWLFSSADDEVPFAIASCEGNPGDKYGKLVIHDTWSVRDTVHPVSEFRIFASVPGATHYELQVERSENLEDQPKPLSVPTQSVYLVFSQPSKLIVNFYDSGDATVPLDTYKCGGNDGDSFGKLIRE